MEATVAICTWNRAELLDTTLASLAKVGVPRDVIWKVIVADNNSSDDTAQVLDRHVNRLPLQRLFVKQQGKSHALNAVIERLQGDLVLWADDDVLFDSQWLASYVDAARLHPNAGFFGGPIIPRFLGGEPDWLRPAWEFVNAAYGLRDFGAEPFRLDANRLPFGANWAVRVPLQKKYAYRTELGRRGELLLTGEETDVMLRLLADGHEGMWTPQSPVEHLVTPERGHADVMRGHFFGDAECTSRAGSSFIARLLIGACHACAALCCQWIGSFYPQASRPERWMKFLMYSSCSWGHVEANWKNFPTWLKPSPLRKILQQKSRPRYVESLAPLLAALNQGRANQATHFSPRADAPPRRLAA